MMMRRRTQMMMMMMMVMMKDIYGAPLGGAQRRLQKAVNIKRRGDVSYTK